MSVLLCSTYSMIKQQPTKPLIGFIQLARAEMVASNPKRQRIIRNAPATMVQPLSELMS